jgi:hypothetical protein
MHRSQSAKASPNGVPPSPHFCAARRGQGPAPFCTVPPPPSAPPHPTAGVTHLHGVSRAGLVSHRLLTPAATLPSQVHRRVHRAAGACGGGEGGGAHRRAAGGDRGAHVRPLHGGRAVPPGGWHRAGVAPHRPPRAVHPAERRRHGHAAVHAQRVAQARGVPRVPNAGALLRPFTPPLASRAALTNRPHRSHHKSRSLSPTHRAPRLASSRSQPVQCAAQPHRLSHARALPAALSANLWLAGPCHHSRRLGPSPHTHRCSRCW